MANKRLWGNYPTWQEAEKAWDEGAEKAVKAHPLKVLKTLPSMPGMTPDTAKNLKWKSLKWMIAKDEGWGITKHVLKKPFTYLWRYLGSLLKRKSHVRDGDFYLYGIKSVAEFQKLLDSPEALLVVGFSYCEKPHECPSGRFTDACIHDPENPVCRQCFIGKAVNSLPNARSIPLFIPTIHYIGKKIFEITEANPGKKVLFIITACEMTLEMFGDWGNMSGVKGIGVRLDGRICNTMRAFELSETGIKPGLTVVLEETQKRILDLLKYWHKNNSN
jgi:hypothetical protein